MSTDDEKEIVALMRAARKKARGYADYFSWPLDRDLEEVCVVKDLAESLSSARQLFFENISGRGRGNDPPDCEAQTTGGERIAFEVTELVSGQAIKAFKSGRPYDWEEYTQESFVSSLELLLASKDSKFFKLKGLPYPGGYVVVIFSDEPTLNRDRVEKYLGNHKFTKPKYIDNVFLILSYDPTTENCPYFELNFQKSAEKSASE